LKALNGYKSLLLWARRFQGMAKRYTTARRWGRRR
jgi:hypothetical protein